MTISMVEIEQQILEFMAQLGISPASGKHLAIDGKLHRYRVDRDKTGSENGFYCIYPDMWPAGVVGSWKSGISEKWKYDARGLDKAEQATLRRWERSDEYKHLQEEREKQRQAEHARASEAARTRFEQAPEAQPDHPYLKKKNVPAYGLRQLGESLLVPLCDEKGRLKSYQTISPDGGKLFYSGASTSGVFFSIGGDLKDGPVLLCEGYATGASLHEMTGFTTICAMNCGNLVTIAPMIRKLYPERKILVAADNDHGTNGNPGITAAEKAVKQGPLDGLFYPEFPEGSTGTDWNDYAALTGMDKTTEVLRERIALASMTKEQRETASRVQQINANDLMALDIPEVSWAVDGFLPSGCSILSGGPKMGKSILALHIALAISTGGIALGSIEVERGDVLYAALEDTKRRLQSRIRNSGIQPGSDLSRLTLVTEIPRQHEGGLMWIENWLQTHPEARLVIIDTLQRFRKPHSANGDRYASDYEAIGAIKRLPTAMTYLLF